MLEVEVFFDWFGLLIFLVRVEVLVRKVLVFVRFGFIVFE